MGFIVMVLSAIIGIALVITGVTHIKNAKNRIWNIVSISLGIALVVLRYGYRALPHHDNPIVGNT